MIHKSIIFTFSVTVRWLLLPAWNTTPFVESDFCPTDLCLCTTKTDSKIWTINLCSYTFYYFDREKSIYCSINVSFPNNCF